MYFLDLLGTLAFAVSGAFKAKGAKLNIFGVVFLGIVTAVGGGTIRDLILGRTPLFYFNDKNYLLVAVIGSAATYFVPVFFKRTFSFFRLLDTVGLATFAIIGVSIAMNFYGNEYSIISFIASMSLGTLTACGGGILRDSLMDDKPFALMNGSNYIKSAFVGSFLFYSIVSYSVSIAIAISIAFVIFLREMKSEFGIYRKVIKKKNSLH